jgi:4-hydroxy-tetrahydrodipicolinate reductase
MACYRNDGLSGESEGLIEEAGKRAVIVKSGNMSMGVNLLAALIKRVAQTLDQEFDIEILEMHHSRKVDAPSGTALMLGRAAAEGRNIDLDQHSVRARDGHTGARCPGDIGFAALRGGSVVGDHTAIFAGPAERIELTHRARSNDLCPRRDPRGAVGAHAKARRLFHGRCARLARYLTLTEMRSNDRPVARACASWGERVEPEESVYRLEGRRSHP